MKRHPFVFSTLALVSLVAACNSGADDGFATGEDEYRIKPKDSENWSNLIVALPKGRCVPSAWQCKQPLGVDPLIKVNGARVEIGQTTRLRPGEHTVSTNGGEKKITLSAGEKRTFVLPVAHSRCTSPLNNVPATDFGKTVTLAEATCPTRVTGSPEQVHFVPSASEVHASIFANCDSTMDPWTAWTPCKYHASYTVHSILVDGGTCMEVTPINAETACKAGLAGDWSWVGGSTTLLASDQVFVPDTYKVTINGVEQTFKLDEGDLEEIPLTLPVLGTVPDVFKTKLVFQDARSLPTAGPVLTITSSCAGDRSYKIAPNAQGTLELTAFMAPTCVYTLNAGGRKAELSQSATNTVKINRVEVDDVEVTRENGSVNTVRGTYELFFNGARVVGPLATNTGLDVLPGTYELVISYSTVDGPKTQRETFTL